MGLVVDIALTLGVLALLSVPLGVSMLALLDAARRPRWVWAFAGRRQVVWLAFIMFATLTVVGGLAVSGYYLARIRPQLVSLEAGHLD